ncbi:MAG: hypothetical protein JO104_07455 [Candidatus Eremiobacteraeota bacterium]|nr:hypothetical protein [Candidatus Eremiobacteraeota bacterium]
MKDATIAARLIPLARTPLGVTIGDSRQEVGISIGGLFDWVDRTFPPDDENAFVASLRDLELLARIGWDAPFPERLDQGAILNIEDVPEDVADALAVAPMALEQCATCRRLCVRDDFAWKGKQLCAWDYHSQVFGRRGPWHDGQYEERHFETLPSCAYVAPALLAGLGIEPVLTLASLGEPAARAVVNTVLAAESGRSHMAVRAATGIWVLREQ